MWLLRGASNRTRGHKYTQTSNKMSENISEADYKCMCLNARSIVNKKNELNIMVEAHITYKTESWANIDITDAELGLTGYVMLRRDRIGRREVILYIKESIQAYEIKLEREADCDEAVWCKNSFRKFNINYWISLPKSKHKRRR